MAGPSKRKKSDTADDDKPRKAKPKTPKKKTAPSAPAAKNADGSAPAPTATAKLPPVPKRRGRPLKNRSITPAPGVIPATANATASTQSAPASVSQKSNQTPNPVPPLSPSANRDRRPSIKVQVPPTLTPTRMAAPVTGFETLAGDATKEEFRSLSAAEWSRAAENNKEATQSSPKRARLGSVGSQEGHERGVGQINSVSPIVQRQVPVALETDVSLATTAWAKFQAGNNGQVAAPAPGSGPAPQATQAEDFMATQAA
jgi:hypothetical protein